MFQGNLVDRLFEESTGKSLAAETLPAKIDEYVQFARASEMPEREKLMQFPLPDDFAGASAYNGADFSYLSGGAYNAQAVAGAIGRLLQRDKYRVLDFGAGMGRLLRFFNLFAPTNDYAAWEVNPNSVHYLRSAFPSSNDIRQIPAKPPLEFACDNFDAIYAWSIWSHFNEDLARLWLETLVNLLTPGGLLLFTIHNEKIVERYGSERRLRKRMKERGGDYSKILRDYETKGFAYWRWYPEDASRYGFDIDTFGMAFITRDYVYANWTDLFEITEIIDDAAPGWQDLLVCRKKG